MRRRWPRLALLAAFTTLLAAPDRAATADTVGSFTFAKPDGFGDCDASVKNELPGFQDYRCNPKGAVIAVQAPVEAQDASTLARLGLEGLEIVTDQAGMFAGQEGHIIVGKVPTKDSFWLVAVAATVANGGARVALVATPEVMKDAVAAWAGMIDAGSMGGAAPQPVGGHAFTVQNHSADCDATVYIDGKQIEVPAGQSKQVDIAPGTHEFVFQDGSGSTHQVTADAPPADTLNAACKGAADSKAPPPPPPPSDGRAGGDVFDGARAAVTFYRTLGNLVLGKEVLGAPISDRPALRLLANAPDDRVKDFAEYNQYLPVLQAAVEKSKADPAKYRELQRLATDLLITAGQFMQPPEGSGCKVAAGSKEEYTKFLDCMIDGFTAAHPAEAVQQWSVLFPRIGLAPKPDKYIEALKAMAQ